MPTRPKMKWHLIKYIILYIFYSFEILWKTAYSFVVVVVVVFLQIKDQGEEVPKNILINSQSMFLLLL